MERILIVDDEAFIRENLERVLQSDGYRTISAENGNEALTAISEQEVDLVLLDLNLGAESGLEVLSSLREIEPNLLVIIITGYGTVESAVEALKLGAYDYIKKPFKADAIHLIVRLALETQSLKREMRQLRRDGATHHFTEEMIGSSPQILQVFDQIREVSKHGTSTVLITGESGTGKELAARAIHKYSERSNQPFIEINCGSLPLNLLESELFGYEKGAFTDAKIRKKGLIEEADGGTLFLDEIGEMDISLQVKLLRVLEERNIRRIGGSRNIEIDTRVIAATNRDLKLAVEDKEFREDLYYRLNVVPIFLPPLRERKEDITQLLNFFIKRFSKQFNKQVKDVSRQALDMILNYRWPGNARELRNVVERICIMSSSVHITPDTLPKEITGEPVNTSVKECFSLNETGLNLEEEIASIEKEYIRKALQMTGANVAKTSRLLQIPRGTLRYKIEKYELTDTD
ncbi:MAG: Fis family transcriptional regulator [Denitrovibrio sp.]|nr:MAG: Fis family transcriptional regulator [Denitrovibrio sp.]